MKKIIKSSIVWLSQEYQGKHLAKHLDNKKNLQNNSHIQIIKNKNKNKNKIFGHSLSKKKKSIINLSKTNHKNSIILTQILPLI